MKIYLERKEINQQEFLDKMSEILQKHYKIDYTKMESTINIDDLSLFNIDNIDFEQYKKYREYIEKEILKLMGIPKDLYEKRKNYKDKSLQRL